MSVSVPPLGRLGPEDPRRVGRFRCVGVLGAGGMGRVLLAFGPDGRAVAVKIVHPHLAVVRDFRDRFRREVALSSRVSGAFTAPIVDADPDAERPWLASLYIPGPTLSAAVAQFGRLPSASVRILAVGLGRALREIHRAGLVHRDLKPANVLLAADGPRVIDFGIARAADGATALTSAGALLGSPAYMSPEQALSRPATQASDIYSLGAVIALACSGTPPFAGPTVPAVLYDVIHGRPDLSRVPSEFARVVRACLDRDPARRPDPDAVVAAFSPVPHLDSPWPDAITRTIGGYEQRTANVPDPDSVATLPAVAEAPKRSRRRWIGYAGAATVVVAAAVVGVVATTRPESGATAPDVPAEQAIDLATLRTFDACAALRDAVAAETTDGTDVTTDAESHGEWGACDVTAGQLSYRLDLATWRDTSVVIDDSAAQRSDSGFPLEPLIASSRGCGWAADPTRAGVTMTTLRVRSEGPDPCPPARRVLAAVLDRLVGDPPRANVASGSLSLLDPCSLTDSATLLPIVGVPSPAAMSTLHRCEWQAREDIAISLGPDAVAAPGDPVRDVDGREVFENVEAGYDTTCVLVYRHPVGETWQTVSVSASEVGEDHEHYCGTAADVLATVIPRLP